MGQTCNSRHAYLIESPQFFVLFPMFSGSHIKNWMDKFLNCFSLKLAQRKPWQRGQLLELWTRCPHHHGWWLWLFIHQCRIHSSLCYMILQSNMRDDGSVIGQEEMHTFSVFRRYRCGSWSNYFQNQWRNKTNPSFSCYMPHTPQPLSWDLYRKVNFVTAKWVSKMPQKSRRSRIFLLSKASVWFLLLFAPQRKCPQLLAIYQFD
jgi:hypothetical protein